MYLVLVLVRLLVLIRLVYLLFLELPILLIQHPVRIVHLRPHLAKVVLVLRVQLPQSDHLLHRVRQLLQGSLPLVPQLRNLPLQLPDLVTGQLVVHLDSGLDVLRSPEELLEKLESCPTLDGLDLASEVRLQLVEHLIALGVLQLHRDTLVVDGRSQE